ncbi:MAG: hypothetical protein ABIA63_04275 [bacterium]
MAKLDLKIINEKIKKRWTDESIGNLFGITRQAVYQYRKRHAIARVKNRYEERNLEIARLALKKMKIKDIAGKFEMSIYQIYRIIRENKQFIN